MIPSTPPSIYRWFGQWRGYCRYCNTGMPLTKEERLPEHKHYNGSPCQGSGTCP